MEVYRKFGRVVRRENGVTITVTEAGEAIETRETFIATPLRHADDVWARHSCLAGAELGQTGMSGPHAERLLLSHGVAIHQFNDIEWTEETKRLHVSLTHDRIRAIIDLADFDFALVQRVAERLARAGAEREAPRRIRLAPHVASAILPNLIGVIELWQAAGGRDGKGQPIERVRITEPPWPNWFRPSYRVRPIRKPLNLTAVSNVDDIDRDLPEAIALLAPPDGLTLRVLVDAETDVYPATVRIGRIGAVAPSGDMMLG